jgi:hypothetical protein
MLLLFIFNFSLLLVISGILISVKKTVKIDRTKNILLLVASIITIVFHYSSFIYYLITNGDYMGYLKSNPNLILPIYPCNLVMWSCLILGIIKNKESKFSELLIDYIFWFGIVSTLVGMFANVDFIKNPTLGDYELAKSIVAHATLMFNVLLLPVFGKIKINFKRNMLNMVISVIVMYIVGLYCNLMFEVLVSKEAAYNINSMFIIHSPFDGISFLTYPIISLIGLVIYFIIFVTGEFINKKREKIKLESK